MIQGIVLLKLILLLSRRTTDFIVKPEDYSNINGKYIYFKDFLNINKFCIGTYVNHPIEMKDVWMSSKDDLDRYNEYVNRNEIMNDLTQKMMNMECIVWKPFNFPDNWTLQPVRFNF